MLAWIVAITAVVALFWFLWWLMKDMDADTLSTIAIIGFLISLLGGE
jgi:hypothetical protein